MKQRVSLLRKLLFEGRIRFSNDKCPRAIAMCKEMRKGHTESQAIQKGSPHKHIFDAIMYCIASEAYDEIEEAVYNRVTASNDDERETSLIAIPT